MSTVPARLSEVGGPFGWIPASWIRRVLSSTNGAAVKVAAFLAARASRNALKMLLSRRRIQDGVGMSRKSVYRALRALQDEGLIKIEGGVGSSAILKIALLVRPASSGEDRGRAVVYKADTEAPWFRRAGAPVIRVWLAHVRYAKNRPGRARSHFTGSKKFSEFCGLSERAVRDANRWLVERGVIQRTSRGEKRPWLTVLPVPNRPVPDATRAKQLSALLRRCRRTAYEGPVSDRLLRVTHMAEGSRWTAMDAVHVASALLERPDQELWVWCVEPGAAIDSGRSIPAADVHEVASLVLASVGQQGWLRAGHV